MAVSLPEFLEARLAEDEADVAHVDGVNWSPARVLAEVAAKRAIVELHSDPMRWMDDRDAPSRLICSLCGTDDVTWPCRTLRALASVHRDHPDYDEGWTL